LTPFTLRQKKREVISSVVYEEKGYLLPTLARKIM